jgi:hypothetical protein
MCEPTLLSTATHSPSPVCCLRRRTPSRLVHVSIQGISNCAEAVRGSLRLPYDIHPNDLSDRERPGKFCSLQRTDWAVSRNEPEVGSKPTQSYGGNSDQQPLLRLLCFACGLMTSSLELLCPISLTADQTVEADLWGAGCRMRRSPFPYYSPTRLSGNHHYHHPKSPWRFHVLTYGQKESLVLVCRTTRPRRRTPTLPKYWWAVMLLARLVCKRDSWWLVIRTLQATIHR